MIYRWGCGGSNNVYLMGHAASVLKPLHDAYVSGRLYKGMKVIYADANGQVRTYSVSYWKVVRPDGDVAWAYAAQSRPSMTLQTCVGAKNSHRLVVRLVATG
ncbi:MAG TPA: sortase [Vitreimonas sp.]|nr:sortase [Vitreimonas sp.]